MDTSLVHRRTPCTHTWGQFSVSRCTHLLNGHLPVWVPLLLLSLHVNVRYDAFHQNPTKFASIETIWRVSDLPQLPALCTIQQKDSQECMVHYGCNEPVVDAEQWA